MQNDKEALITGLLFGSDKGFSSELKALTRAAGVTHLVAASGANLRFVLTLWSGVFSGLGHRFFQWSSLLGILLYWSMAEQSGSLWRASGMWVITWLGALRGKKIPLWYSLGATTALTTVAFPGFLTPGFWLSFLAIAGVYFSQQLLSGEKKSALFPQHRFLRNKVALSLVQGTIIFACVTLWLWPQYKVFEPIGILATFVLSFWVDPLVWTGIVERAAGLNGLDFVSPDIPLINFFQEILFDTFYIALHSFAALAEDISPLLLVVITSTLTIPHILTWRRERVRKNHWRRFFHKSAGTEFPTS